MSTVSIHCPNCGSTTTNQIKPDNYRCLSCQSSFNFVRANDKVVTQDVRTHNCAMCGRAVKAGYGNICKFCNTEDVCDNCVQDLPRRGLICKHCLIGEERDCATCGLLSEYSCISCKNLKLNGKLKSFSRTCKKHFADLFWYPFAIHKTTNSKIYRIWKCDNCDGLICNECVVTQNKFFSKKYYCANCSSQLKITEEFLGD